MLNEHPTESHASHSPGHMPDHRAAAPWGHRAAPQPPTQPIQLHGFLLNTSKRSQPHQFSRITEQRGVRTSVRLAAVGFRAFSSFFLNACDKGFMGGGAGLKKPKPHVVMRLLLLLVFLLCCAWGKTRSTSCRSRGAGWAQPHQRCGSRLLGHVALCVLSVQLPDDLVGPAVVLLVAPAIQDLLFVLLLLAAPAACRSFRARAGTCTRAEARTTAVTPLDS